MRIRYASHYLRLGDQLMRYPLLDLEGDKLVGIGYFEREVAGTIFVDGGIILRHPDYPQTLGLADLDCVEIDQSSLQVFLSIHKANVEVVLPR